MAPDNVDPELPVEIPEDSHDRRGRIARVFHEQVADESYGFRARVEAHVELAEVGSPVGPVIVRACPEDPPCAQPFARAHAIPSRVGPPLLLDKWASRASATVKTQ